MSSIIQFIKERFTRTKPLPAGIFTNQSGDDETAHRLHLRMQPDGNGILVVNASTVLHLNPTATEFAFHMIKGATPEEAAQQVASRYNINRTTARQDFMEFRERVQTMIQTPDLDPITFMDFERVTPHSSELTAPLRLDCALTYNLPEGAPAAAAPTKRVERELNTDEWKQILDKAWQAGIPHITLTGGEPTLRDDLPDIISHAEKNGQVCGLLSDGLNLANKIYLDLLLQTGLDHLLFILEPENKKSWKALSIIMPEDLFTTVHITIDHENQKKAGSYLEKLSALEVTSLSLSTSDPELQVSMETLKEQASELGMTLRWDLPVPYSKHNPMAFETVEDEIPDGAGKTWLYVEPDGDVLPGQGLADQILGNFLTDPFEAIYR
ncbi:PqqD family peptide modification chaperone [Chloroflexota bacterium]